MIGYGLPEDVRQVSYVNHEVGQLGAVLYEANLMPW